MIWSRSIIPTGGMESAWCHDWQRWCRISDGKQHVGRLGTLPNCLRFVWPWHGLVAFASSGSQFGVIMSHHSLWYLGQDIAAVQYHKCMIEFNILWGFLDKIWDHSGRNHYSILKVQNSWNLVDPGMTSWSCLASNSGPCWAIILCGIWVKRDLQWWKFAGIWYC